MSNDDLHSILNDTVKCTLFDWYLGTIQKTAVLKFWLEIQDYKTSFSKETVDWRLDIAQAIYERYLKKGSKNFVDLPNKVLEEIEKKLRQPSVELFDSAQEIVFNRMKNNFLVDFIKSDIYKNYVGTRIFFCSKRSQNQKNLITYPFFFITLTIYSLC